MLRRRRGRQNRGGFHNRVGAAPQAGTEVPRVRPALRGLRHAPGEEVARARRRRGEMLRLVGARPRRVPRARRQGRGAALGALGPEQVHRGVRGPGRVARPAHVQERPRRAHARRLAHRGRHMLPRGRLARGDRRAGPLRRPALDRRRRDQLQEGA